MKGLARHVQNLTVIWRLGMAEIENKRRMDKNGRVYDGVEKN